MGHHNQNGSRNAASEENRPSWRPQDQSSAGPRHRGNDDDHDYGSWRDRNQDRPTNERDPNRWEGSRGSELGHPEDRNAGRSTERYGQGQSGYSAGRYGDDWSQHVQNRNDMMRGPDNREDRGLGVDDRFTGRGEDRGFSDRPGDSARHHDPERHGSWRAYDQPQGTRSNRMMSSQDRHHEPGMRNGGHEQWMGYQSHDGRHDGGRGESMDYRRAGGPGYSGQSRDFGDGSRGYGGQGYGGSSEGGRGYGQGYQDGGRGDSGYGPTGQGYGWQVDDGSHGTQDDPQRMGSMSPRAPRQAGPHRGKGPQGYKRSDERIREAVCEVLADDEHIDASQIHVEVKDGEVTLSGTVDDRRTRREAEDCAIRVSGVRDVLVQLRVRDDRQGGQGGQTDRSHGMQSQTDRSHGMQSQTDRDQGAQRSGSQPGHSLSTQTGTSSPDSLGNTAKPGQGKPDADLASDKKARS